MTKGKHFKRRIREEARRTGASYAATRARLVRERAEERANALQSPEHDDLLPPKVPSDRAQIERAIVLLGNVAQCRIKNARAELTELIGVCPDPATATAWKTSLRVICEEELFDVAG